MPGLLAARRDRPARPASPGREVHRREDPPGARPRPEDPGRGRPADGRITCPARPPRRVQRLGLTPQAERLILAAERSYEVVSSALTDDDPRGILGRRTSRRPGQWPGRHTPQVPHDKTGGMGDVTGGPKDTRDAR